MDNLHEVLTQFFGGCKVTLENKEGNVKAKVHDFHWPEQNHHRMWPEQMTTCHDLFPPFIRYLQDSGIKQIEIDLGEIKEGITVYKVPHDRDGLQHLGFWYMLCDISIQKFNESQERGEPLPNKYYLPSVLGFLTWKNMSHIQIT